MLFRDSLQGISARPLGESRVNYVRYWINDAAGVVRLCLWDAPQRDVESTIYRESHGVLPGKVIDVAFGR